MPSPTYTRTYVDGDFTTAKAIGAPRFSAPFSGDSADYLLMQDYMIASESFAALALNTAHPVYTDFVLVAESENQDLGGAIVKWTRTYAKTPATRNDYSSISYSFIGFYGRVADIATISTFPIIGRNRFSQTVNCRIQNDYYLIGSGGSYATPDLIPAIREQKYYVPQGSIPSGTFVPAYAPGSASDIAYGKATDNLWDISGTFAFPGAVIPTIPTYSAYLALVTAGTEIVAEPSQLARWMGNVYVRTTKYVVAL